MAQENLSALMDGECTDAELDAILAEFESSEETRASWSRMCAVRDALSDSRVAGPSRNICAGVMAAIAAEPMDAVEPVIAVKPVMAPVTAPVVTASNVVPFPVRPAAAARNRLFQPLVGLAAAASIAGAVVLGGNSLLSHPVGGAVVAANDSSNGNGSVAIAKKVSTTNVAIKDDATETRWGQLDSESARQLNGYMMEHSNYRAEQGMGGSLSYARMAVRTADYRPASEQH